MTQIDMNHNPEKPLMVTKRLGKKLVKVPLTREMAQRAAQARENQIKKMGRLTREEEDDLERQREREAPIIRRHQEDPKKWPSLEEWREKQRAYGNYEEAPRQVFKPKQKKKKPLSSKPQPPSQTPPTPTKDDGKAIINQMARIKENGKEYKVMADGRRLEIKRGPKPPKPLFHITHSKQGNPTPEQMKAARKVLDIVTDKLLIAQKKEVQVPKLPKKQAPVPKEMKILPGIVDNLVSNYAPKSTAPQTEPDDDATEDEDITVPQAKPIELKKKERKAPSKPRPMQSFEFGPVTLKGDRYLDQYRIIERAKKMKQIPFRIQLAVAANNGSTFKEDMAPIKAKERKLQQMVQREASQLAKISSKPDSSPARVQKESNDLARAFARVGMNQYAYNYPNQKTMKLAIRKSKKTYGGIELVHGFTTHKNKLEKLAMQERRLEARKALAAQNPNATYYNPHAKDRVKYDVAKIDRRIAKIKKSTGLRQEKLQKVQALMRGAVANM